MSSPIVKVARDSLPVFSNLMGYTNSWHHDEWYNKISDDSIKNLLLLAPRNHAKTTCVETSLAWMIGNNRDIRIMLVSNAYSQSALTLRHMKAVMETPIYKKIFPEIEPLEDWWNREEFTVKRDMPDRNPTAFATGIFGSVLSRRCDIMFLDDMINREITDSEAKNIQVRDFYEETLTPCLTPEGRVICTGTRWGFDDFYSYLMAKESFKNNTYVYKAINYNKETEEEYSLWPNKWPLEQLKAMEKDKGSYYFAMQYQNEPLDPATAPFKREWIRIAPMMPSPMKYYMAVDPAATNSPRADYTTIIIVGVYHDKMYVVDVFRDKIEFPEQLTRVKEYYAKYKPVNIGVEVVAYQAALSSYLKKYMLPIKEIRHARMSKEARIISLTPFIENGSLLFNKNFPLLVKELLEYPKSKHDDQVDCLEMCVSMIKKTRFGGGWASTNIRLPI